jgi:hypothetical protein
VATWIDHDDLSTLRRWTTWGWILLSAAGVPTLAVGALAESDVVAAAGKGLLLFWGLPLAVLMPVRFARALLGQVNRNPSSR